MKTIVFIDGENFMHQVRDVLYRRRLIKNRDELASYDIRGLLAEVLKDLPETDAERIKIRYYSTKVHISEQSDSLRGRTEAIKEWGERLQMELTQHRIEFVEAGHLLVREGKRCVECGHREPVLMEKGLDVQLATDLIRTSGDNVRLVLLSSDGDLTPAVVESVSRGSEVVYLGFRGVSNATLGRASSQRFTINAKQVVDAFHAGNIGKKKEQD